MTGILAAALATYYAGGALPHQTVKRLAGEKLDHMSRVLRQHGFFAVLAARSKAVNENVLASRAISARPERRVLSVLNVCAIPPTCGPVW
jgi:hypothetical protein